ncbi:uncharacterized protein BDW43DRAFT_316326 [Aspergillus alliaceus]|uniref:uncharacterized protein n=1 Tax=Petromyces alliaceus TaxID=209559 RepID=UPI0012A66F05|nr:uncharacterized protein BDW43DRAFT_316326 [Aspergillus alliaceus]KAB8228021.1 hypothetical protein BDW43DRAFT_316326 [Aspergillus alliaceus]
MEHTQSNEHETSTEYMVRMNTGYPPALICSNPNRGLRVPVQYYELFQNPLGNPAESDNTNTPGPLKNSVVPEVFTRKRAEEILSDAPYPNRNNKKGRRPHAHYDIEKLFTKERTKLRPLETVDRSPSKDPPVLWSYPAERFDYSLQNRLGEVKNKFLTRHRIITDREKNIKGMVSHPPNSGKFFRATERVKGQGKREDAE